MSDAFRYRRLDRNDAAVLLVDHQSGLCNLARDFSTDDFKNIVLALAGAAKYFNLPRRGSTSSSWATLPGRSIKRLATPPGRGCRRPACSL